MLTDTKIRALRPREKAYKVADGLGLYLIINPNGSRWWRFKYRFSGREKLLSLGTYPDTSLKSVTVDQLRQRYAKYLKPKLGIIPIATITVHELRKTLLKIQDAGHLETAHRVRALAERIFRYAIATGRAERNIAADLHGTLAAVATTHFAAVTKPTEIGALLRAIGRTAPHDAGMGELSRRSAF